ncbi:MAG: tyrosine-type recombinase/integrase [Nocardioides sp.]
MSIRKLPSGRWHARLKSGREFICGRTFDTQRDAKSWLARERAAMAGGIDPRAGRVPMRKAVTDWLGERESTVAKKTYVADAAVLRLMPNWLAAMQLGAVSDREVSRALVALTKAGLVETSVKRFRASLSSFFAWAVRERMVQHNPVTQTRVPKTGEVAAEMKPFLEAELEEFAAACAQLAPRDSASLLRAGERAEDLARLADILLVAGWTGLRWSELREARGRDFVQVPMPALMVRRAAPEGIEVKTTKSGKSRLVPVADRVLSIVEALARGRGADELLFVTTRGARLHASSVKRAVDWNLISKGRRIHDLRHTAACLWLVRGVDLGTVQAWMGHASIATTNLYLHHLGTTADRTGLARLNRPGNTWGTNQDETGELQ